ncbi:MAG TPA: hypothetical protein VER57_01395 [Cyanobium sp.]|nr:hypothetical protein [Cyanobium sp.]
MVRILGEYRGFRACQGQREQACPPRTASGHVRRKYASTFPLSGRLRETEVTAAWKDAAAVHHPDRGGAHDTMQAVNGARDLLLRRGGG